MDYLHIYIYIYIMFLFLIFTYSILHLWIVYISNIGTPTYHVDLFFGTHHTQAASHLISSPWGDEGC